MSSKSIERVAKAVGSLSNPRNKRYNSAASAGAAAGATIGCALGGPAGAAIGAGLGAAGAVVLASLKG